jgi:hypothetical protein
MKFILGLLLLMNFVALKKSQTNGINTNINYKKIKEKTLFASKLRKNSESKLYLEKMMNELLNLSNQTIPIQDELEPIGCCQLKNIEMSLKILNCGRVLLNTTMCTGFCKSSESIIANTNFKKITYSGCKATDFNYIRYTVRCTNKSLHTFQIKAVSKCSCFKIDDKIQIINAY